MAEIEKLKQDVGAGGAHPMQVKKELARRIVTDFHSGDDAKNAEEDWARQFQKDETPESVEEITVKLQEVSGLISDRSDPVHSGLGQPLKLDKIIARAGLTNSVSEAGRKIKEKAVRVDGELVAVPVIHRGALADPDYREVMTVRVGRQTKRIIVSN
jgi:tyrosyl-tRNA synthetase